LVEEDQRVGPPAESGEDPGTVVGGEPSVEADSAVGVGPAPEVACPVDAFLALVLIDGGGRDPPALLPKLAHGPRLRVGQ
jgi:hypothetical protein